MTETGHGLEEIPRNASRVTTTGFDAGNVTSND